MWTHYFNEIPPITCSQCSENAFLIRRMPQAGKAEGLELRIFQCGQGHLNTQLVDYKQTDQQTQSLAERMIGFRRLGSPSKVEGIYSAHAGDFQPEKEDAGELQSNVLQCEMLAKSAKSEKEKQDWLALAERWRRLIAARD